MTPPLVDYLMKFNDTFITVASNIEADAQRVANRHPQHMDAAYLDVFNVSLKTLFLSFLLKAKILSLSFLYSLKASAVETMVSKYSLVISFIPPWLHMHVLSACVKVGVNVATSSYISPEMLKLDAEAKRKGLVILNECGLDPGIDIMGTMKVVHDAKADNCKVVSYESYCGGLIVAE